MRSGERDATVVHASAINDAIGDSRRHLATQGEVIGAVQKHLERTTVDGLEVGEHCAA